MSWIFRPIGPSTMTAPLLLSLYASKSSTIQGRYSFISVFSFIVMLLTNHSISCRVFSPYFADVSLPILQNSSLHAVLWQLALSGIEFRCMCLRCCFFGFGQMSFAVSFGRGSWSSSPRIIVDAAMGDEPCSAAILEIKIFSCDLPDARKGRLEAGC